MESSPIYLDYAATTPIAPQVLEAMMPYLTEQFGNPSSAHHTYGQVAKQAVEKARAQVAECVHVDPACVVFTSGGTESNNLAIKGIMNQHPEAHLIVSAVEHVSILDSARRLERAGVSVTYVKPTNEGVISVDAIKEAFQPNTKLVSVMWGNNEVGSINDIEAIASLCREKEILFHSDAAQAVGHLEVDANLVDLLTFTGHKLYAPKGVGVLIVKSDVTISPQIVGGEGQRGRRSGTLNVHSIVGLGKACTMCDVSWSHSIEGVRNHFETKLKESLDGVRINGCITNRLPHISSVQFDRVGPDFSPSAISGVACSSGSACQSGDVEGSHVLQAMGISPKQIASTIRFSFGRQTDELNANNAINLVVSVVNQCKE